MRTPALLIGLFLMLTTSSAQAVVAEGDTRPHPTIQQLNEAWPHAKHGDATLSVVGREEMDRIAKQWHLNCKPGYRVAVIVWRATGNIAVCTDVPIADQLIMLVGTGELDINAGIDQIDQTKVLGGPQDILPKENVAPDTEELPVGVTHDAKDPLMFHATKTGIENSLKVIGIRCKKGYHAVYIAFKDGMRIVVDDAPADLTGAFHLRDKSGNCDIIIFRDDGKPVSPTAGPFDVIEPIPEARSDELVPTVPPKHVGEPSKNLGQAPVPPSPKSYDI